MKKTSVGAIALVATAFTASAAQAADGTITINGEIVAQTCEISGNGGGKDFTVTLPTVSNTAFKADGDATGRTSFTIALSKCGTTPGNVAAFFEAGGTVDAVTGRLKNTTLADAGGAGNVQIQLLNDDGKAISVGFSAAGTPNQNLKSVPLDGAGAATLVYAAEYFAHKGVPTAGKVSTTVTYSIHYN